ncbi:MAG: TonB-dependent receptor [Pseudomonas sp.]
MPDPITPSVPFAPPQALCRLSAALLLALAAVAPAAAQQDVGEAAQDEEKLATLDRIEVTGTRLRQDPDIASIVPVHSFSAEELQRQGVSTLADVARVIPQFGPSVAGDAWTTLVGSGPSPGLANRTTFGLGGLNLVSTSLGGVTLVLVNGRRLSVSGQAFSGQGNLEGFDLGGIPLEAVERIDILPGGASSIYGADALAGVVNVILKKADYQQSTVGVRYDSPFEDGGTVRQVNLSTSWRSGNWRVLLAGAYEQGDALKRRDRWYAATSNLTTFGGRYDNRNSWLGAVWSADGSILAAIPSGSTGHASVADFAAAGDPVVYDAATRLDAISPWKSKSVLLNADYEYAPWLNLHLDLRLNEKVTTVTSYPQIGYYYPSSNRRSSPLLVPAGSGGNPYDVPVYLNKVFTDLAQRSTTTARNPAASVAVSGDFGDNARWHYDASLGWARSEQDYHAGGVFNTAATNALAAALAAGTGPILLYDSATGNPNAAGVLESYLYYDWNTERSDTYTVNAAISGTAFSLPGGDAQVVAGVEYLENRASFDANPQSAFSNYLLSGTISRDNKAVFAEAQLPLLSAAQRIPFIDVLELNLSVRRDDYNDVGSAVSPRYALLYRPVDWISLRASRSEGFKPASLWNLYAPYYDFGGFTFPGSRYNLQDPVLGEAVGTIGTFQVGHPELEPATSVSSNLGLVVELPFVPGLTLGVEYTRTVVENAIGSVGYQDIIDDYPERVVRDADGRIVQLDTSGVNLANSLSESIVWTAAYRLPTERFGQFLFNASYARPIRTETRATATSVVRQAQLPERASGAVAWRRGELDLSLAATWQSDFNLYPYRLPNFDYTYTGYLELTPRVAWRLPAVLGGLDASLAIVNVLNEEPSLKAAGSGYLTQDYRGRRWVLELKKTF